MSGGTSLKFLIPKSSCQQNFVVSRLFADGAKEKILHCGWAGNYRCLIAPGYFPTIENDHALITVPRDLNVESEEFICEVFGKPKSVPSRCLCSLAGITRGEPVSPCPSEVGPIVGVSLAAVAAVVVVVMVVVLAVIIYKISRSEPLENKLYPKPWSHLFLLPWIEHNEYKANQLSRKDDVELGAYQPLRPQADDPTMYVPQGSATDSQKSSKPPSTASSTRKEKITTASTQTVPPKKETIIQSPHSALDNTSRITAVQL